MICYEQMRLTPEIQDGFDIQILINGTNHTTRIMDKNYMTISINVR